MMPKCKMNQRRKRGGCVPRRGIFRKIAGISTLSIIIISIALGLYHVALHFIGFQFIPDPLQNFLYFVTPGLIIGYFIWRRFIEPKIFY